MTTTPREDGALCSRSSCYPTAILRPSVTLANRFFFCFVFRPLCHMSIMSMRPDCIKTSNPEIDILTPVRSLQVRAAAHSLILRFRVRIPGLQRLCGAFLRSPLGAYHTALIPRGLFNDPYRVRGYSSCLPQGLNLGIGRMVFENKEVKRRTLRGEVRWETGNDTSRPVEWKEYISVSFMYLSPGEALLFQCPAGIKSP